MASLRVTNTKTGFAQTPPAKRNSPCPKTTIFAVQYLFVIRKIIFHHGNNFRKQERKTKNKNEKISIVLSHDNHC